MSRVFTFICLVGLLPAVGFSQKGNTKGTANLKKEVTMPKSDDEPMRARFVSSDTVKKSQKSTEQTKMDEIDSIIRREDQIIEEIFFEEGKTPSPSFIWYYNNFSDERVRLLDSAMDSIPDEVLISLVKKKEEFCFPVKNEKTSPYGWRWKRPHRGVDIALNTGDSVFCCFNGVVRIARKLGNYGNLVVVRHYNGLETVYAHFSKISVKPKQIVKAGDLLGFGGSTGRSTGPHLHFEVRFQYEPFDPEWILDFSNFSLRVEKLYLNRSYFGIEKPKTKNEYLAYKADGSLYTDESKELYHKVGKGEDVMSIASKYKVRVERIKAMNKVSDELYPGQVIRIR